MNPTQERRAKYKAKLEAGTKANIEAFCASEIEDNGSQKQKEQVMNENKVGDPKPKRMLTKFSELRHGMHVQYDMSKKGEVLDRFITKHASGHFEMRDKYGRHMKSAYNDDAILCERRNGVSGFQLIAENVIFPWEKKTPEAPSPAAAPVVAKTGCHEKCSVTLPCRYEGCKNAGQADVREFNAARNTLLRDQRLANEYANFIRTEPKQNYVIDSFAALRTVVGGWNKRAP